MSSDIFINCKLTQHITLLYHYESNTRFIYLSHLLSVRREDARDALVLHKDFKNVTLEGLPEGSVIGTSSLRRTAQLSKRYPHLKVTNIRGNLNTRLKKLDEFNNFQGIVLAVAGLQRMNWDERISQVLFIVITRCGSFFLKVQSNSIT